MLDKSIWNKINDYRLELMGIAALMVMIMHIYVTTYEDALLPYITPFLKRGNIGVDIFLFLSGCGLFFSMSKIDNILLFYKRRFNRVLIPWMIISIPYWIFVSAYFHYSLSDFILNVTGMTFWIKGCRTVWYPSLICILYILYPAIFWFQKQNKYSILLFIALDIIVNSIFAIINPTHYQLIEVAMLRIPAFLLGSYWGYTQINQNKNNLIHYNILNGYVLVSFLLFLGSVLLARKFLFFADILYRYGSIGAGIIIISISLLVLKCFNKNGIIRKILRFYGSISLEIYLTHVFILNIVVYTGFGKEFNYSIKLLIETLILVIATIVSCIITSIRNNIKHKIFSF